MNLIEANRIAYSLVAKHLPGQGWRIDWGNSRSAAGRCQYRTKTLQFSTLITREVEEDEFTDTVLHEIAHALVGPGHGHNAVWKRRAKSIGCTGDRTWTNADATAAVAKYRLDCRSNTCSFHAFRNRLTKAVETRGRCPECKTPLFTITTLR